MKKIISFCLAFTLIMSSLNFEAVQALSNKINEVYTTLSQSELEEMNGMEDKESDYEEISDSEDEKSETEEIGDLEDKKTEYEEANASQANEVDSEEANISDEKEAELEESLILKEDEILSYANPSNSVRLYTGSNVYYTRDSVKLAIDKLTSLNESGEVIIEFRENYTITTEDAEAMKVDFNNNHLIFKAVDNVTVTVPRGIDFELYHKSVGSISKKITFENITFEFLGNNSIYANGTTLNMGQNIVMKGDQYPRLFGGSKKVINNATQFNTNIKMYVYSGIYEEITMASGNNGININWSSELNFYGGYAKNISTGKSNQNLAATTMNVNVYGGRIDCIEEAATDAKHDYGRIDLKVYTSFNIKEIKNIRFITIGKDSELTISGKGRLKNNLVIEENAVLNIIENSIVEMNDLVIKNNATIFLPANRETPDKAPLVLGNAYKSQVFNLKINTAITTENFYLMRGGKGNFEFIKNNPIIKEEEYFYVKVNEEDATNDYLMGIRKEQGPIIYDIEKEEFSYVNMYGIEQEAWWINDKIKANTLNLSRLYYDDLAKAKANEGNMDYYVLAPSAITFKIRGTGADETIKFNNNRHSNRKFNIEFENLSASNSEFSFTDINSIIVTGDNSITQEDSKTALTFSFAGNNNNNLSFTNNSSNFVVYSKDEDNDKYTISNTIINSKNSGGTSIINMSFEEDVSSVKNLQIQSINGSNKISKFSTKVGYDIMSVLLKGDNKDYLLCNGDKTAPEDVYYYQINSPDANNSQNSGAVGTKFTLTANGTKNYYNVNNKQRVHVVASKENHKLYYLENTLEDAMDNHVNLIDGTHEVVFLGNYEIRSEDAISITNHSNNSNEITFKTKVDDWKYTLNVDHNIELEVYKNNRTHSVIFNEIKFNYKSSDKWIYGNGRTLIFGDDVEMEGRNYPSISGGQSSEGNGAVQNTNVTIHSGTYMAVTGNLYNTLKDVNLTINGGTFNGEVSGISGGTADTTTLTINNGIFNYKVSGVKTGSTLSGALNFTINNGTFKQFVSGASSNTTREKFDWKSIFKGKSSKSNTKITGALNMTINNGNFNGQVNAASEINDGVVNLKIVDGSFGYNVGGLGEDSNNSTLTMTIEGGEYIGQVFGQYSVDSRHNTTTLNIDGGIFNNQVYGMNDSGEITINVSGGTFRNGSRLTGNNHWKYADDIVINIKSDISIPVVDNFDKLVVGKDKKVILTITDKTDEKYDIFASELLMNNGSEVKLQGNNQSAFDKITLEGDGNTLTLAMDRDTTPLVVKGEYVHGGKKLILNALGEKANDKVLIKFLKFKADVDNFNFIDEEYYIREMDNGLGNTIKVYEKMSPTNLTFKLDINSDKLEYSVGNRTMENVWWYQGSLSNEEITFSKDNMFIYKGMELFKNMNNIASGDKVFEITNEGSDKNITIDLGQGTNFDLKLNNSKLTNSTLSAKNMKNMILEGKNSISELSGNQTPFDCDILGEVSSTNEQSYLSIFTKESNLPFSNSLVNGRRDLAKVIDFKFYKEFNSDEQVRLVPNNGNNELSLTIPKGTGRLGVVFGKANANKTYNLYHENGNAGTSVYVAGNTDVTFKDSFDTSSNNALQTYDYVRRANPVRSIKVDVTKNLNFSVDTQSIGLNGINQDNWQQYFNATDMEVQNNSVAYKDVFIDEKGVAHNLGKINTDLEFGYLGVSPSNTITNGIKLVNKSQLDANITSATSGVKLALKLDDGQNGIALDESDGIATNPLGKWTVSSFSEKSLKIVPDFDANDIFFNVSNNLYEITNSSHNFTFRFGLATP